MHSCPGRLDHLGSKGALSEYRGTPQQNSDNQAQTQPQTSPNTIVFQPTPLTVIVPAAAKKLDPDLQDYIDASPLNELSDRTDVVKTIIAAGGLKATQSVQFFCLQHVTCLPEGFNSSGTIHVTTCPKFIGNKIQTQGDFIVRNCTAFTGNEIQTGGDFTVIGCNNFTGKKVKTGGDFSVIGCPSFIGSQVHTDGNFIAQNCANFQGLGIQAEGDFTIRLCNNLRYLPTHLNPGSKLTVDFWNPITSATPVHWADAQGRDYTQTEYGFTFSPVAPAAEASGGASHHR